jgi:hypothetical protein
MTNCDRGCPSNLQRGLAETGSASGLWLRRAGGVAMVPDAIQICSIMLKQLLNSESWNRGIFA